MKKMKFQIHRYLNLSFNYTDHLGNIRLTYTKDKISNELKILDENHYYPFGLKHQKYTNPGSLVLKAIDESTARPGYATSTDFMYKYNGKGFQDELGLNMYAMDMRHYDPAIARWVVHDPVTHFDFSPYNAFDNNPVFWADPSGADAVNIGYDRVVDTNSFSGSATWSGGFREISGERKNDEVSANQNSSSNSNANSAQNLDNGDPEKDNKGTTIAGSTYSALGEHGEKNLKSGEYTQTNGKTGNFNDRPDNKLSQNAKASKNFAKGLSSLRLLGTAGNIYSFGDGFRKDFNSFANGEPSIENTAVASGGVFGGAVGGAVGGAIGGALYTKNPYGTLVGTIGGAIVGGIWGEDAVREFFNQSYDYNDGVPILHKR